MNTQEIICLKSPTEGVMHYGCKLLNRDEVIRSDIKAGYTVHTIEVNGVEWSVGDKVSYTCDKEKYYFIIERFTFDSSYLGWKAHGTDLKGAEDQFSVVSNLTNLSKLPSPKQETGGENPTHVATFDNCIAYGYSDSEARERLDALIKQAYIDLKSKLSEMYSGEDMLESWFASRKHAIGDHKEWLLNYNQSKQSKP